MLRSALLGIGALLVALGVGLSLGFGLPAGLGAIGVGCVLLLSLLIERHRYKQILDAPPGPEWQPTGERFVEPGNDAQVAVYYHPRTGRRSYVRIHSNADGTPG
jgi:hypothetical protein